VRVAHFPIPSTKCFAPLSSISLTLTSRPKEARVGHFPIPSAKYFTPLTPILL